MRNWKIEVIEDTRDFDFDAMKPIPGTGDYRPCDHCDSTHAIHVTIYNPTEDRRMVVGSTCAKNLVWNAVSLKTSKLRRAALEREARRLGSIAAAEAIQVQATTSGNRSTIIERHATAAFRLGTLGYTLVWNSAVEELRNLAS